jgi:hypothetical protein
MLKLQDPAYHGPTFLTSLLNRTEKSTRLQLTRSETLLSRMRRRERYAKYVYLAQLLLCLCSSFFCFLNSHTRTMQFKKGDIFFNYGCFPQTWEDPTHVHPDAEGCRGDNDPLDVCEIGQRIIQSGVSLLPSILKTMLEISCSISRSICIPILPTFAESPTC